MKEAIRPAWLQEAAAGAAHCPRQVEGAVLDDREMPPWKRVLDLVCILLALPALAPLLLLIAGVVKLVSPGPVLFRQRRIGWRGKPFVCLKFRTMHVHADTQPHEDYLSQLMRSQKPMIKLDSLGDSRLIPSGRFLRSTGLDELPQLLNVLLGDMSLVGPRPCTPEEYKNYLPWQKQRFATLPGLTGLWQVSGKNRTTFNEMLRLDILYAQNRSLWLDLGILLKTLPVLVTQIREMRPRRISDERGWPAAAFSSALTQGGVQPRPAFKQACGPVDEKGAWPHPESNVLQRIAR